MWPQLGQRLYVRLNPSQSLALHKSISKNLINVRRHDERASFDVLSLASHAKKRLTSRASFDAGTRTYPASARPLKAQDCRAEVSFGRAFRQRNGEALGEECPNLNGSYGNSVLGQASPIRSVLPPP